MFGLRFFQVASLSTMLLLEVSAQFGVGNRKQAQNTQFQELQEMAKKQAADGGGGVGGGAGAMAGMAGMEKLLADAMKDPEAMEAIKQYGQQFSGVLDQMMQMSPDELQKSLSEAMKVMTEGDIVDTVINQKETVLEALKASGTVTADEMAKYEADPQYFELKMRESFDTMKDLFSNPEYLSKATEAVKNIKGLMDDPSKIAELTKSLGGTDWTSDEQLEEVRLQFLRGDFNSIPGLGEVFQSEEMQEMLRDPAKWKELVKDGLDELLKLGLNAGGSDTDAASALPKDEL